MKLKLKSLLILILTLQFSDSTIFAQEFGIQLYSLRNQFKTSIEES